MKPILYLSITVLFFASCKNNMDNGCASATDSLKNELVTRDLRITQLEDSLRNAMASMPATTVATESAADSGVAKTTNSAAKKVTTGHSFYKTTTYKRSVSKEMRSKYPGEFPEGSSRILREKDLKFLSEWGLKVILNEIYARHGMTFSNTDLQSHFSRQAWYHGATDNVDAKLSITERRNVEFIKNYKFNPQIGV